MEKTGDFETLKNNIRTCISRYMSFYNIRNLAKRSTDQISLFPSKTVHVPAFMKDVGLHAQSIRNFNREP